MTAAILARAPRQSAILAAVVALHFGAFILVAAGMLPRLIEVPATQPIEIVPVPPLKPVPRPDPVVPNPGQFVPALATLPDIAIPAIPDEVPSVAYGSGPAPGTAGSGLPSSDYRPPALAMRNSRLASLIDDCYPSAARRLGEEGRAVVNIVIDAEGRAAAWAQAQGTGSSRLDAALECVVRRLHFQPGRRDGRAVVAEVQLPIVFRLN